MLTKRKPGFPFWQWKWSFRHSARDLFAEPTELCSRSIPYCSWFDCLMSSHWVARVWCLVRWCVTCVWQASDRSLQTVTTSSSLWRDCVEHCPLFRMDWTDGVCICFRLSVSRWALSLYWHCAARAIYMSRVLNFLRRSLRRWLAFCCLTSRSLVDTLACVIFDFLFFASAVTFNNMADERVYM